MEQFKYTVHNILNNNLIKISLESFWNEIFKNKNENDKVIIQFKIINMELQYRSISMVDIVTKNDYTLLLKSYIEYWDIKFEEYHELNIKEIIYSYKEIEDNKKEYSSKILKATGTKENNKNKFKFRGYNLPGTMDITK